VLDRLTQSVIPRLGRMQHVRLAVRLAQLPLRIAARTLSKMAPRDRRLIVYGAPLGRFGDNTAYLFMQAATCMPHHRHVWITPSRSVRDRLRAAGHEAELRWSMDGVRKCLTAGMYVYGNYPSDINRWFYDGALTFNLWHGIPLKRIERDILSRHAGVTRRRRARMALKDLAFADENHVPDMLLSTSSFVSERCFRTAFAIPQQRLVNAGYPRTDHFRGSSTPPAIVDLMPNRTRWHRLAQESLVIGYFPTWRDTHRDFLGQQSGFSIKKLAEAVRRRGGVLLFKPHGNTLNGPAGEDAEGLVRLDPGDDVHAFLPLCHALITDYSSIAFDYMLLNRPIIYYVPDLDQYAQERGMYFKAEEAMPGRMLNNPEQLYQVIDTLDVHGDVDPRLPTVRERMWEKNTEGSSARISARMQQELAGT
jgi:CDP-glycerol glycerophosphotransferase (TagB/SpsB family)